MTTNVDLDAALIQANRTHLALWEKARGMNFPGNYQLYTYKIPSTEGLLQNNDISAVPGMRRWTGARQEKGLRAYTQTMKAEPFESTVPINRFTLLRDKTGAVGKALNNLVGRAVSAFDERMCARFISASGAGPTGSDGVALFSTAHPHVNSGSGHSNLGSGTNFSHANFSTGRAAGVLFKDETGRSFKTMFDTIHVGANLEQRVREAFADEGRVTFTNINAAETTTATQNATLMPSVYKGINIVIDTELGTSYYWTLIDASKQEKPMFLQVEEDVHPVNRTDMTDPRRWERNEFLYAMEGSYEGHAGAWWTCYRGTGTA